MCVCLPSKLPFDSNADDALCGRLADKANESSRAVRMFARLLCQQQLPPVGCHQLSTRRVSLTTCGSQLTSLSNGKHTSTSTSISTSSNNTNNTTSNNTNINTSNNLNIKPFITSRWTRTTYSRNYSYLATRELAKEAMNCQLHHHHQHQHIIQINIVIIFPHQHCRQHSQPTTLDRGTNQIYHWHPHLQQPQPAAILFKVLVFPRLFPAPFRRSLASRPTNHGPERGVGPPRRTSLGCLQLKPPSQARQHHNPTRCMDL